MNEKYLKEELQTIRNLCDISELVRVNGRFELLPTLLEVILIEAQELVDEFCVERE